MWGRVVTLLTAERQRRHQLPACAGHGGDVALKSRDPSDYQVSILEVAGTAATSDEIFRIESLWKAKLQSRRAGIHRRTVCRALKRLEKLGLVRIVYHGGLNQGISKYRIRPLPKDD